MTDPTFFLIGVAACFVLAGFVKGVTGMGLPTVAMGLLGLVMPGAQAAALLVLPSLLTNVWQLLAGPRLGAVCRRLAGMQAGVFAGTFLTIGLLTKSASAIGPVILGVVLAAYGVMGLFSVKFAVSREHECWVSPLVGLFTGLITGATGVFVIPAVPYLASLIPDKEELIQSLGLSFTVSTVALATALAWQGSFTFQSAGHSLLAILPAMVGMLLGQAIRGRLSPEIFRKCFFTSLILIGVSMVVKAAWLGAR